jgi:hypothetical protein
MSKGPGWLERRIVEHSQQSGPMTTAALARSVFGIDQPSAAQLGSIRRVLRRLRERDLAATKAEPARHWVYPPPAERQALTLSPSRRRENTVRGSSNDLPSMGAEDLLSVSLQAAKRPKE